MSTENILWEEMQIATNRCVVGKIYGTTTFH